MFTVFSSRNGRAAMVAVAAALVFHALPANAGEPHAHGEAKLDVAIEGASLTLQFSSPLDNLVGFERAPRTDKERQQVDAALAQLNAAESMFKVDPAARCKLSKVELSSAALKLGKPEPAAQKEGHADLDASIEFTCADAAKAKFIDVDLFVFKRLHRVDAQVAAPGGQLKRTLKPSAKRLSLTK
jgi:hypothetical protein